jgi:hypothetical protein
MGHLPASTGDLFGASDHSANDVWQAPRLVPPAYVGTAPAPGSACSRCLSTTFWSEKTGRNGGWRCFCCVPATRPDDRLLIVDTTEPATV